MRVIILSDTHAPRRWKGCPPAVARHLESADLILHAGDVCTAEVLVLLETFAPVRAVFGNNDLPEVADWGAPETWEFDLDGVPTAMIHDSGQATGRTVRMHRRFPTAELVIFGHSHIPMDVTDHGVRIFNPGSPTDRRRQPFGTLGVLEIADGAILSADIIDLPR